MSKTFFAGTVLTGMILAGGAAGMVSAQSAATQTGLSEEQIIELATAEMECDLIEQALLRMDAVDDIEFAIKLPDEVEVYVEISGPNEDEYEDHDHDHDHDMDEMDDDMDIAEQAFEDRVMECFDGDSAFEGVEVELEGDEDDEAPAKEEAPATDG